MQQNQFSLQNYTDTGFKQIKAPAELWNIISSYWERNKDKKKIEKTIRKYAGSNFLKHARHTHLLPDLPPPFTLSEHLAE